MARFEVFVVALVFLASAAAVSVKETITTPKPAICTQDEKHEYDGLVNKTEKLVEACKEFKVKEHSITDVLKNITCNNGGLNRLNNSYEALNDVESYIKTQNDTLKTDMMSCFEFLNKETIQRCTNESLGLKVNVTSQDHVRCQITKLFFEKTVISADKQQLSAACDAQKRLKKCIVDEIEKNPKKCSKITLDYTDHLFELPHHKLCAVANQTKEKNAASFHSLSLITFFVNLVVAFVVKKSE